MDFKQGSIDFETHLVENNTESQSHLDENRIHFSAQCSKIYNLLMAGEQLTVFDAITKHGISSLPRRLADILGPEHARTGIAIGSYWKKPENGVKYKVWFMTEADKEWNRKLKKI